MKNLDKVSYALIVTTLLVWGLRSGAFFLDPALPFAADGYGPPVFFPLFAGNLAVIFIFTFFDRFASGRRLIWTVLASVFVALTVDLYLRFLFVTPGSFILGGGRGIVGNLSNFWTDWIFWFAAVWLVRAALFAKEKLHHYFNTSIALFAAAVLIVVSSASF